MTVRTITSSDVSTGDPTKATQYNSALDDILTALGQADGGDTASRPGSPALYDVYLDTDESVLYACFSAGTWTRIGVPSGTIAMWGTASAPTGWLLCDGTSYTVAAYGDLWAEIGDTFGGDGGTNFNVPDFRQRFPLGKAASGTGSTLGGTGGAIDHTHVYTTVPQHTHTITDPGHEHKGIVAADKATTAGSTGSNDYWSGAEVASASDGETVTTGITINNAGSASPSTQSNNPPFLAINFIIKT